MPTDTMTEPERATGTGARQPRVVPIRLFGIDGEGRETERTMKLGEVDTGRQYSMMIVREGFELNGEFTSLPGASVVGAIRGMYANGGTYLESVVEVQLREVPSMTKSGYIPKLPRRSG